MKPRKKAEPYEHVKVGKISLPIYRVVKKGYENFVIDGRANGGGKLVWRSDLKKARKEAKLMATKIAQGEGAVLELTKGDRFCYVRSMDNLKPTGVALELATAHFAEAFKILGGDRIIEAARYFAKKQPVKLPDVKVQTVVDELIDAKQAAGKSERYRSDLRYRLGTFAEKFPNEIANVTAPEIQKFLDGLKLSPRSYINFRRVIGTLFKFAKRRG